jgi:hypothetical protein
MIGIIVQLAASMATFVGIKVGYEELIFRLEKGIHKRSQEYYPKREQITCPKCRSTILLEPNEKDLILFQCDCGLTWEDHPTHIIARKNEKRG